MKAIHTRLTVATALMSMALVSGSIDDVFGQSVPSVSTYATGLTNPRGLTFGPDGNLYVAEAGTGGSQTPADIDPSCPVMVNVFSPFTAGYSGRVTRVLADGTTETVADNLPSMTDVYGRQLRADRRGVRRRHALRADRDGRLLACPARRSARDPAGQPRRLHDQCRQPERLAGRQSAALHQGHQPGDHRSGTRRRVPFDVRGRPVPVRGRDQPRHVAPRRSAEGRDRAGVRHVDRQRRAQPDRAHPARQQTSTSAPSARTAGRRSSRCSTRISRAIRCRSTRPIRSSAWPGAATGSTASRSSRPTSSGPPTTRISSPSIP